jgi:arsenate reductase (glutaredoxin)
MKIYHNPKCAKSREVLNYLISNALNFEVCNYIKNPLSKKDLIEILNLLNYCANDLVRKNEDEYKQFIKGKSLNEDEILSLMLKYPKLIERPIVIVGEEAVVARPLEKLKSLFEKAN